jgi:hypothetical protein
MERIRWLLGMNGRGGLSDPSRIDPPFVFARRIDRTRQNRVINDAYARTRKGKKWHRIYEVDYLFADSGKPRLAALGRSFAFACGDGTHDNAEIENYQLVPMTIREGVPDADICKSCAASDAIYGKGEIKDKSHWERWNS